MADPTPTQPPELLKTQPAADGPGAGGWVPAKTTPIWAAVVLGIAASSVPVLLAPAATWQAIVASAISGAATAIGTYFGMRSAGPRQP